MTHLRTKLTINLLGAPTIIKAGAIQHVKTRKVLGLLAYLVTTQQVHSRASLLALLWPEKESNKARSSLRHALSSLKKLLGEGQLAINRHTVGLHPQAEMQADVVMFRRLLAGAEKSADLACYEEVIAFYHNDFLDGFGLPDSVVFDEWLYYERESLRQQYGKALEQAVLLAGEVGDYQKAITYARLWVAFDVLHEEAHRILMRLHAQIGERSAAVQQFETCKAVLWKQLGVEPEQETIDLHESILANRVSFVKAEKQVREKVMGNLPRPGTQFVGRHEELHTLGNHLADPNCRLLTLTGLGGSGKTRLAYQLAEQEKAQFADGAWLVNLAPIESSHFIPTAIATALDLKFQGTESPETQLIQQLQDKELLLVLDNFEHLIEGADIVNRLLEGTNRLKIIVTSREGLNLTQEWAYEVGGLSYPDDIVLDGNPAGFLPSQNAYSAIELFIQRARQTQYNFVPAQHYSDIVQICRLVEGLPLAIEMAASWVRMLPCSRIVAEIARGLDFLASNRRDVAGRHRSMKAVFDCSWQQLTPIEQEVLAALSVFRGGFTQEAASEIAGAHLFVLYGLMNKSLVRRTPAGRYELHELLRQFAVLKLAEPGTVASAHSRYYVRYLQNNEDDLFGTQQKRVLQGINADLENMYHAWLYAAQDGQVEQLGEALHSLYNYHAIRCLYEQGQLLFERTTSLLEPHLLLTTRANQATIVRLMARRGEFLRSLGRMPEAEALLKRALDLAEQLELQDEMALCYQTLGVMAYLQGRYVPAGQWLRSALHIVSRQNDLHRQGYILMTLGAIEQALGNYHLSQTIHQKGLAIYEEVEYQWGIAHTLRFLGQAAYNLGEYNEARDYHQRCLDLSSQLNNDGGIALALNNLGLVAQATGGLEEACTYFQEAVVYSRASQMQSIQATSLQRLAQAMVNLSQHRQGQQYYQLALQAAVKANETPLALDILVDMALQLKGGVQPALLPEIMTLAERHPASKWETQKKAEEAMALLPAGNTSTNTLTLTNQEDILQRIITQITADI